MINKLTSALAWLAGTALALLGLFYAGRKSARDEIVNETAEQAQQLQLKARDAMAQGLANEQQIRDKINSAPVNRVDLE